MARSDDHGSDAPMTDWSFVLLRDELEFLNLRLVTQVRIGWLFYVIQYAVSCYAVLQNHSEYLSLALVGLLWLTILIADQVNKWYAMLAADHKRQFIKNLPPQDQDAFLAAEFDAGFWRFRRSHQLRRMWTYFFAVISSLTVFALGYL